MINNRRGLLQGTSTLTRRVTRLRTHSRKRIFSHDHRILQRTLINDHKLTLTTNLRTALILNRRNTVRANVRTGLGRVNIANLLSGTHALSISITRMMSVIGTVTSLNRVVVRYI